MLWVIIILSLLVAAGIVAWWRAGRQAPGELHRTRGQKFGSRQARDQANSAYDTWGVGKGKSHFTDGGK